MTALLAPPVSPRFKAVKAEVPILFKSAMVVAILGDNKAETRRTRGLAEINELAKSRKNNIYISHVDCESGEADFEWFEHGKGNMIQRVRCPYGGKGTRLWVRENFYVQPELWAMDHGKQPVHYAADTDPRQVEDYVMKPCIHMPRWACRINLQVTEIQCERLHEITETGAVDEGCHVVNEGERNNLNLVTWGEVTSEGLVGVYKKLWEATNGAGSWAENPFVWVVKFRRTK